MVISGNIYLYNKLRIFVERCCIYIFIEVKNAVQLTISSQIFPPLTLRLRAAYY